MKKNVLLLSLLFLLVNAGEAQLLKKLKDKASKVLEPKSTSPGSESTGNNGGGSDASNKKQSPPDNGSVVFSLGDDESLLYDESRIIVKNQKLTYSFVIKNRKYEYFLVEDGKRTGPFKEAPIKSQQENEESSGSENDQVSLGNDRKDAVALKYSKTIGGKLYLVFNGKNFGPYDYVSKMLVSPDEKHFFALVTIGAENKMTAAMGMGYTFIVNDAGIKQKIGTSGMAAPVKFSVSSGFSHAMATVLDQKNQEAITASTSGKEEKTSMAAMYSGDSKTLINDNGDIVSVPSQSPTQVMVNGKEAASFKVPVTSIHRVFLAPDLSKSVYYEKGKIYRADGTEESLTGVLFPKVATVGSETAVYYFKVHKADTGSKDVYLCKKVI